AEGESLRRRGRPTVRGRRRHEDTRRQYRFRLRVSRQGGDTSTRLGRRRPGAPEDIFLRANGKSAAEKARRTARRTGREGRGALSRQSEEDRDGRVGRPLLGTDRRTGA